MKLKILLILGLTILSVSAFAGPGEGGGGDLCEDRIKIIRDDIVSWIHRGGSANLKLANGKSVEFYNAEMLSAAAKMKVRCVKSGDKGYPITYAGVPKMCVFDKKARVGCDSVSFMAAPPSEQYRLIHHELAGIAKIEIPDRSDSDYSVSDQITGFLEKQMIERLAIRPAVADPSISRNFPGWKVLSGAEAVRVTRDLQNAIASTEYKNCKLISFDLPKPEDKPSDCGGEPFYYLEAQLQPFGGTSLIVTKPGVSDHYIGCDGSTVIGHARFAFLQNVANPLLIREYRAGDNEVALYPKHSINNRIYEFDRNKKTLKSVVDSYQSFAPENVGTIALPVWKSKMNFQQTLRCDEK